MVLRLKVILFAVFFRPQWLFSPNYLSSVSHESSYPVEQNSTHYFSVMV